MMAIRPLRSIFGRLMMYLPSRRVQRIRDIRHTITETCRGVYQEKKSALLVGEEVVVEQMDKGKDIMAILRKELLLQPRLF